MTNLLVSTKSFAIKVVALAILGAGFGATDGHAMDKPPLEKERKLEISGGPYCGIYSLYAAMRSLDIPVQFDQLLQPKYVTSFSGSSLSDLNKAAEDFGAQSKAMEGLTAAALRSSPHPMILHVRRPGLNTTYAHWVLFLGIEGNEARIVDPPNSVERLPLAELLALWDGVALVVAREPLWTWQVRWTSWLEQGMLLALTTVLLGAVRFLTRGWRFGSSPSFIFPVFALLALGGATVTHLVSDEGFLRSPTAVAQVAGRHFEPELAAISVADVVSANDKGDTFIIDARFPSAYEAGHLPGAVNLPIYAGPGKRSEVFAGIPATTQLIVVYCQSEHCGWAAVIASDLALRGYNNVALFPGGWNAWKQHEQGNISRQGPIHE